MCFTEGVFCIYETLSINYNFYKLQQVQGKIFDNPVLSEISKH